MAEKLTDLEKELIKVLKESAETQSSLLEKQIDSNESINNKIDSLVEKIAEHAATMKNRKEEGSNKYLMGIVVFLVLVLVGREFSIDLYSGEFKVESDRQAIINKNEYEELPKPLKEF